MVSLFPPLAGRKRSRLALAVPIFFVLLALSLPIGSQTDSGSKNAIQVGRTRLFTVQEAFGIETASDRADRANQQIESALLDPDCDPDEWKIRQSDENSVIQVCNYSVLLVTEADAARAEVDIAILSEQWLSLIRGAFAREKQAAYSARLLRRAILGLVLPLAYLGILFLVHLLARRIRARLLVKSGEKDEAPRARLYSLASSVVEPRILAQIVWVLKWAGYAFFTYVFVLVLSDQFPRTARWSDEMIEPLAELSAKLVQWTFSLILPRLILLVLVLVAGRLLLEATRRLFHQVRHGRLRFEPFLSPDTAGPAELTARLLIIATGVLLVGLLVPGEVGTVLLGALGLAALALTLGAWDLASNMLAGMINLYGRPFRTGQRIHTENVEGTVQSKGLLLVRLETDEGRTILLPNRWVLQHPVEIVKRERKLYLEVAVRSPGGPDAACGLFRHASHAAGLKREEGRILLTETNAGILVFDLEWPVPKGETPADCRYQFIEALLSRAAGLGIEIVSARPRNPRDS